MKNRSFLFEPVIHLLQSFSFDFHNNKRRTHKNNAVDVLTGQPAFPLFHLIIENKSVPYAQRKNNSIIPWLHWKTVLEWHHWPMMTLLRYSVAFVLWHRKRERERGSNPEWISSRLRERDPLNHLMTRYVGTIFIGRRDRQHELWVLCRARPLSLNG